MATGPVYAGAEDVLARSNVELFLAACRKWFSVKTGIQAVRIAAQHVHPDPDFEDVWPAVLLGNG